MRKERNRTSSDPMGKKTYRLSWVEPAVKNVIMKKSSVLHYDHHPNFFTSSSPTQSICVNHYDVCRGTLYNN